MVSIAVMNDMVFRELIAKRAMTLLGLSKHISQCQSNKEIMIRPLIGALLSQSAQIEELLDAYGAGSNCEWCAFRSLTAAIKHFSDASYELLHIRYSLPTYRLLPIEKDFAQATEDTLEFTVSILQQAANKILTKAQQLDLPIPSQRLCQE